MRRRTAPEWTLPHGVIDPAVEVSRKKAYSLSRRGVDSVSDHEASKKSWRSPSPEIMHQDSVLWMWATNRHLAAGEAGGRSSSTGASAR